jgi:FkbM family methyltransferase
MKILGRDWRRYTKRLREIPSYAGYFIKCFRMFKQPMQFLRAYLTVNTLESRCVTLRDGLQIHLSNHPHDIITVFLVFIREDYGAIKPGSRVVDIGANIGVFSLYAVHAGAAMVHAYEPNSEAFACLKRNIEANGLEGKIVAHQVAVTSKGGETVKFPTRANMYNAILADDTDVAYELVQTIGMPAVMENIQHADLVKMDCEGAEYDLLFNAGDGIFSRMDRIELEYHDRRVDEITRRMIEQGFILLHHAADTPATGNLWFARQHAAQ